MSPVRCQIPTKDGGQCPRWAIHAASDRGCLCCTRDPVVLARRLAGAQKGDKTSAERQQRAAAQRLQSGAGLLRNAPAVSTYLGCAARLSLDTRDASHAAAAAKLAEVALRLLDLADLEAENLALREQLAKHRPDLRAQLLGPKK